MANRNNFDGRSINIVGPRSSRDNSDRAIVDATVARRDGHEVISILTFTFTPKHAFEISLDFTDVCNLRSLLEDLQAGHADAMTALETAGSES